MNLTEPTDQPKKTRNKQTLEQRIEQAQKRADRAKKLAQKQTNKVRRLSNSIERKQRAERNRMLISIGVESASWEFDTAMKLHELFERLRYNHGELLTELKSQIAGVQHLRTTDEKQIDDSLPDDRDLEAKPTDETLSAKQRPGRKKN